MSNHLTNTFIDYLFELSRSSFEQSVNLQAKKCLLDFLGASLAGSKIIKKKTNKFLNKLDTGSGNITVIGLGRKAHLFNALLINSVNAHVTELDDGSRFGMIHPGAVIIPALLAIGEKEKISGKKILAGIIVGYEATIRLATTIQPSHKELGFHATGTCGAIGTSIGVATALNFTKSQFKNSLSASASGSSGLLKAIEGNSELKPFNAGRATLCGVMSAYMAQAGFNGPDNILDGKHGFISMMAKQYDLKQLNDKKNSALTIEQTYFKPYASCRHSHSAIEAVLMINQAHKIKVKDIKKVNIKTYQQAIYRHDHKKITSINSAKMSIPYSVAVALKTGQVGLEEFNLKHIQDPDLSHLITRINLSESRALTRLVPNKRSAIVEIETVNNKSYSKRVDLPKGEPERPLSEQELEEKFISLARYGGKSKQDSLKIIEHVYDLENQLDKIYKLL